MPKSFNTKGTKESTKTTKDSHDGKRPRAILGCWLNWLSLEVFVLSFVPFVLKLFGCWSLLGKHTFFRRAPRLSASTL